MNVRYVKRDKGGYYAFIEDTTGRERCVIVRGLDGTGKVGSNNHWYIKHSGSGKTVISDTRKDAVATMARIMGWS